MLPTLGIVRLLVGVKVAAPVGALLPGRAWLTRAAIASPPRAGPVTVPLVRRRTSCRGASRVGHDGEEEPCIAAVCQTHIRNSWAPLRYWQRVTRCSEFVACRCGWGHSAVSGAPPRDQLRRRRRTTTATPTTTAKPSTIRSAGSPVLTSVTRSSSSLSSRGSWGAPGTPARPNDGRQAGPDCEAAEEELDRPVESWPSPGRIRLRGQVHHLRA